MANINVFSQFLKEPPSAMDYADRFAARDASRQQNALNQLVIGEKVRGIEDQNRLRQLYMQNPSITSDQLRQAGFRDEANKADATALEKRKTESEIGYKAAQTSKEQVETQAKAADAAYEKIGRHAQNIASVRTPEDIVAYVDRGIADGVPGFTPEMREQAIAKFQQLGSVEAWKKAATENSIPVVERFKQAAEDARAKLQADTQMALQGNVLQDTPEGPVVINKTSSTARPVMYGGAPGANGAQPTGGIEQLKQSIFQQESSSGAANTSKPNYAGAVGPMQMLPSTFDGLKRAGVIPASYDINNPEHNKAAGNALIDQLSAKYGGDPAKVAAAYYGGPGAINPDGTINRNRRDPKNPNAPTVGQYVDQVVGRMSSPGMPSSEAPGARVQSKETWGAPTTLTRQDGTPVPVQYNARTGAVREVPGFGPKPGTEKPLNDTQSKALLFGSRMQEADKLLNDLSKEGVDRPSAFKQGLESIPWVGSSLGAVANATVVGGKQQQVEQAQRDFLNAVLRRESGAAIGESEFESARRQYFPQIGDDAATIAQKARNRQLAIQGILAEVPANQRNALSAPSANKPLVANNGWSVVEVK